MAPPSGRDRVRWSGASTHHPWDGRTRCRDAPDDVRGVSGASRGDLPYASSMRSVIGVVLALSMSLGGCAGGAAASFDPTGPCVDDGSAPGAYPDLEALVPPVYEGKAPDRLDSGRNCTAENLANLQAAGIEELRYAGGTWGFGGERAAALVVFHAAGLTADELADFYSTSAADASRTEVTAESTPTIAGRAGHRLDTKTGERTQTVVVWPATTPDQVNVVITNDLPDPKIQAAIDAFGGR